MNDSKCPHCGEQMVWKGDMLSGGLACKIDHYAEAGYDVEGSTPEENAAIRKAFENAFQSAGIRESFKGPVTGAIPENKPEEYPCDYVNDRCNFSEGGRLFYDHMVEWRWVNV